jgi:hypothetical protein
MKLDLEIGGVSGLVNQDIIGRMGKMAAANGGYGAGGKVAFKLIYREKTAVSIILHDVVKS